MQPNEWVGDQVITTLGLSIHIAIQGMNESADFRMKRVKKLELHLRKKRRGEELTRFYS